MGERAASIGLYERAEHAARIVRAKMNVEPRVAIVLGSGLGGFADECKVDQIPVVAMQGRVHYYEGYTLEEVTFPVRTFKLLGINTLILTNAAGGINVQLSQGGLMVLSDHVNLMGESPLRGPNDERFGPRFPDMTAVYSPDLQELVVEEARNLGVELRRGIYAALAGPSYETPAEIHLLRNLGADAVGMSTVPEAIVARHMGMDVLGISCITNMAAGISDEPINHEEVMATGDRVRETFTQLLRRVIGRVTTIGTV
jgi:purine-nucleoside phosphorylase